MGQRLTWEILQECGSKVSKWKYGIHSHWIWSVIYKVSSQTYNRPIKLKWHWLKGNMSIKVGSWSWKRSLIKMRYRNSRVKWWNRVEIMKSWWAKDKHFANIYSFSSVAMELQVAFFMMVWISFMSWQCLMPILCSIYLCPLPLPESSDILSIWSVFSEKELLGSFVLSSSFPPFKNTFNFSFLNCV